MEATGPKSTLALLQRTCWLLNWQCVECGFSREPSNPAWGAGNESSSHPVERASDLRQSKPSLAALDEAGNPLGDEKNPHAFQAWGGCRQKH